MPRRYGPPVPKFTAGPRCGPIPELGLPECPYRSTSFGYAPPSGDEVNSQFLFLLEALGPDEVETGRNAVGPTGEIFNKLLRDNTPIRRSEQCVANTVRCRPVVWQGCPSCEGKGLPGAGSQGLFHCRTCKDTGQVPLLLDYNKDHTTTKPTPGQVRECAARYTDVLIAGFQGKTIVALGKTPLAYMTDRPLKISEYRGTIFSAGEMATCSGCGGPGTLPGKAKKCPQCKGSGFAKCVECGRTKHLKKCISQILVSCAGCVNGAVAATPKTCKKCEGAGKVPSDPDNPYVCEKLKPGQLLFPTYHPAWLVRQPTQWPVVERDFSRMAHLEEELVEVAGTVYDSYPPVGYPEEQALLAADTVSIDLETTGLDAKEGEIVCVGATHRVGYGCALDADDGRLAVLLQRPRIVGQNFILFDWWWLHNKVLIIPNTTVIWDTRFAGKLLNPDTPNDLTYLAGEFAIPPIRGYWKTRENYRDKIEQVACMDVDATLRVAHGQEARLQESGQFSIMEKYIMPLSRVVFKMRVAGMKIDKGRMEHASKVIKNELLRERALLPPWGGTHTEGQHAAVQHHLYDILHLPTQKNRDTGKRTGNSEALDNLNSLLETNHRSIGHLTDDTVAEALVFIQRVQHLRDFSKLESSFLRYRLSPEDFVHPALNPCGAGTFRFTCSDPNAQQIPKCKCKPKCFGENPECLGARQVFIPDYPDWRIMSVDLKQAEVVGFLWQAEEWGVLRKVLIEGMDAHVQIAAKILGRDPSDQERDDFKTTTFALLFGEAPRTTAARLHRSVEEIESAREFYFKMLPGVTDYRRRIIHEAMSTGKVRSPFNISRYIYVDREKGRAANQACNHPIQNIPPMVIGKAMIILDSQLPPPARLWMQVHDELDIVYPVELESQVYEAVMDIFRSPVPELPAAPLGMAGGLVFNADVKVGLHWGAMKVREG